MLAINLDTTIVNVALPTISDQLDAGTRQLQWIVDAYLLVFAGLLLTAGTLGDRFGRKRALQSGLVLFGGGSLGVLAADSANQLIALRAVMGAGGALIMPATLSIISNVFPREERMEGLRRLIKLPDNVTFEQAARFGYIGTSYGAMKKANALPGQSMLVDGISGTLGLGAALLGLAMGITKIFGTGRNKDLLDRVRALDPSRIEAHSLDEGSTAEWVKARTDGTGVDFMISALGPGAPASTMMFWSSFVRESKSLRVSLNQWVSTKSLYWIQAPWTSRNSWPWKGGPPIWPSAIPVSIALYASAYGMDTGM